MDVQYRLFGMLEADPTAPELFKMQNVDPLIGQRGEVSFKVGTDEVGIGPADRVELREGSGTNRPAVEAEVEIGAREEFERPRGFVIGFDDDQGGQVVAARPSL